MDDLTEMLEHYRITRLIAEYCHGCDRGDEARMAGVYAAESWDDHGNKKMPGAEFAAAIMAERAARDDAISHHLGQTQIRLDGDSAGAETYFLATVQVRGRRGDVTIHHMGGRYVDDLVREDGHWRIKRRLTTRDWSYSIPVEEDFIGTLEFIPGQTTGADVSFQALGLKHSGNEQNSSRGSIMRRLS